MNTNIFYRDKKCINCNTIFKTPQVKTNYIRLKKKDEDNCPYYKLDNPLFYEFHICTNCHMVFTDHFNDINSNNKEIIKKYLNKIRDVEVLFGQRNIQQALRLSKLALFNGEKLNESNVKLAFICLRISWFYRYIDDTKEEYRFLYNAYNHFEQAFNNSQLKIKDRNMPEELVVYLLAEISFRIGVYMKTKEWFNQLFRYSPKDRYVIKGRDRWSDIRGQISKIG